MDWDSETRVIHIGATSKHPLLSITLDSRDDEEGAIDNSTKKLLENCIASLEHAKYGLCFSSGTAAITSISMLLNKGDHVVMFDSVYHGTRSYLSIRDGLGHVEVTFADLQNLTNLKQCLKSNTKMVWLETPCNPTMKMVDIAAAVKIVRDHGNAFVVVDNTFMTPHFQNPLLFGVDIVMHSVTKYMNGHADVLMGAAATNSEQLYFELRAASKLIGSLPSPVECYLALRGLKTLHLRMERHMQNATQIAEFLEGHHKVEKVYYPGLPSHPQHDLVRRQCRGYSGMVSFCVRGGTREVTTFVSRMRLIKLAVSLGGVESLMDVPSLMTASALKKDKREELGITDNLLRMSVGLEDATDIIADLEQALEGI